MGSPRILYTTFLLGMLREFFGLIMSGDPTSKQVDNGISCLIAFVPDKAVRDNIWNEYTKNVEENPNLTTSAAIQATGKLIDYFTDVLELTSSSTGAYL
jgi:hypothetical protein